MIGIGVFHVPILKAVTATYNTTVRIVSSTGTVLNGVASAVTANYNETVRVVDSTGHVIDSFANSVNVKDFGAKCDVVALNDAQMTSSGTTLTAGSQTSTGVSVANASGGNTVYTTTSTLNFGAIAPLGTMITFAGFTHAADNGTFKLIATSNTTLTVANASGVTESAGNSVTVSFPVFASTDVGKSVCVEGVNSSPSGHQLCGTISAFTDANHVTTSFTAGLTVTKGSAFFGTIDQTAIVNAITSLWPSNGGAVFFPALCGVNTDINMPTAGNFVLMGQVGGQATFKYGSGAELYHQPTAGLVWLTTTGVTTAGLNFLQPSPEPGNQSVRIQDMLLQAGAGWRADGAGTNVYAIKYLRPNNLTIEHVFIFNWEGGGILLSDNGQGPYGQNRISDTTVEASFAFPCLTIDEQATVVESSSFSDCPQGGIKVAAPGYVIIGNSIENNSGGNVVFGPSFYTSTTGLIAGNYSENTAAIAMSGSAAGAVFAGNLDNVNKAEWQAVFSAAGTALPSAANYGHYVECVSDETPQGGDTTCSGANTIGTTYASGGSTHCLVQSDKTNWKVTGQACF